MILNHYQKTSFYLFPHHPIKLSLPKMEIIVFHIPMREMQVPLYLDNIPTSHKAEANLIQSNLFYQVPPSFLSTLIVASNFPQLSMDHQCHYIRENSEGKAPSPNVLPLSLHAMSFHPIEEKHNQHYLWVSQLLH